MLSSDRFQFERHGSDLGTAVRTSSIDEGMLQSSPGQIYIFCVKDRIFFRDLRE